MPIFLEVLLQKFDWCGITVSTYSKFLAHTTFKNFIDLCLKHSISLFWKFFWNEMATPLFKKCMTKIVLAYLGVYSHMVTVHTFVILCLIYIIKKNMWQHWKHQALLKNVKYVIRSTLITEFIKCKIIFWLINYPKDYNFTHLWSKVFSKSHLIPDFGKILSKKKFIYIYELKCEIFIQESTILLTFFLIFDDHIFPTIK